MPSYKAGVAGPIPLADGRVVTAEQGEVELEVDSPHDADLIERGVIVLAEGEPQAPEPPAPVKSTPPAAPGVPADSGEKAGA
jgi:hypothetical protein